MTSIFGFKINTTEESVQSLLPPNELERFEGVGFSSSGNIMGIASSDTNTVFLFRRKENGLFEDKPYWSISGPSSGLDYPHDVSFSGSEADTELLAVAQRRGAITIYEKNRDNDNYSTEPIFEICGPATNLNHSDGVAFVPPANDHLAACNLTTGSISFYRRLSISPIRFTVEPVFELKHPSLRDPDGLAFSPSGRWLALANHGNHSVSIFERRRTGGSKGELEYGPEPHAIIEDPGLRHPHSVAFTPKGNHLAVTNAGANYFSVYGLKLRNFKLQWSHSPVTQKTMGPEDVFREINARNKMEGGPKGLAIHKNTLAVCSPNNGVRIYSFRERLFG
ncbi:MAG TPA: beta-propeller fold lactonase family protein [Pyrinomonadaceae bacterium]|nr:beta-propeller fold lactonase family protein [Pyrinomonadaceae bacterium]